MLMYTGNFASLPPNTQIASPQSGGPTVGEILLNLILLGGAAWLGYRLIRELAKEPRDTYKYVYLRGRSLCHGGLTNDLDRREDEHRGRWPGGSIRQVGRRTTRTAALAWERAMGF